MKSLILIFLIIMTKTNFSQTNTLVTKLVIEHIVKYPISYKANDTLKSYPLILTLHGHGSNEKNLIGLSTHFNEEIIWISGRGPHKLRSNHFDWYQLPPTPSKIATTINL